MFQRLLFVVAALLLGVAEGGAKTTKNPVIIYDCVTGSTQTNSLFTAEYQITIDPKSGKIVVLDGLIQAVIGKPLDATLKRETDAVLVVGWRLKNVVNNSKQSATLDYTLAIQKANGRFTIQMIPLGFSNSFQNKGSCSLTVPSGYPLH